MQLLFDALQTIKICIALLHVLSIGRRKLTLSYTHARGNCSIRPFYGSQFNVLVFMSFSLNTHSLYGLTNGKQFGLLLKYNCHSCWLQLSMPHAMIRNSSECRLLWIQRPRDSEYFVHWNIRSLSGVTFSFLADASNIHMHTPDGMAESALVWRRRCMKRQQCRSLVQLSCHTLYKHAQNGKRQFREDTLLYSVRHGSAGLRTRMLAAFVARSPSRHTCVCMLVYRS